MSTSSMTKAEPPRDRDREDLTALSNIVHELSRLDPEQYPVVRLMRWNIGLIWDHARQQTQGHRYRRRDSWWSPAALKAGNDTIGEHVVPAKLVAGHVLDLARRAPQGSRLSVEDLRPLVSLPMAVITRDEDRRLSACGRGSAMPGPVDWSLVTAGHVDAVWARYRSRVTEKEVKLAAGRRASVDLAVGQELFHVEEFRQHEDYPGRRHGSPLD